MATADDLRAKLNALGLDFLFDVFDKQVLTDQNVDVTNEDSLYNAINSQPAVKKAFDDRFAGNAIRIANGLAPLKPSEYLNAERNYKSSLRDTGMPIGFYDTQADLAKFIGSDISRSELENRIVRGYRAAQAADPDTKAELQNLYGITESDLASYFIDPTRATDVLNRKKDSTLLAQQVGAAQIAGQARAQAGIGLTSQQAETLQSQGVTMAAARQGFSDIAQQQELFATTAGEQTAGEKAITQEEQVAGVFGTNAAAAQRIATRRRKRQAEFEAGGGFAATQRGITGLTTAGQ